MRPRGELALSGIKFMLGYIIKILSKYIHLSKNATEYIYNHRIKYINNICKLCIYMCIYMQKNTQNTVYTSTNKKTKNKQK